MARTLWTRWGRGSCEGYSLTIGDGGWFSFRCGVSRGAWTVDPPHYTWSADVNGTTIARNLADQAGAVAALESELRLGMREILVDWARFEEQHGNRKRE